MKYVAFTKTVESWVFFLALERQKEVKSMCRLSTTFFPLTLWNHWLHGSDCQKSDLKLLMYIYFIGVNLYEKFYRKHWDIDCMNMGFGLQTTEIMATNYFLWLPWILNSPDFTLLKNDSWCHNQMLPACQPQAVWTLWSSLTSVKLNHKWTPLCHISIQNLAFFPLGIYFYRLWAKGKLRSKGSCQDLKPNIVPNVKHNSISQIRCCSKSKGW